MDELPFILCEKECEYQDKMKRLHLKKREIKRRYLVYKRDKSSLLYAMIGQMSPMNWMHNIEHVQLECGWVLRFKKPVCLN